MRIDALLVRWGWAPSRTKAQALIAADAVWVCDPPWRCVQKPSETFELTDKDKFEIRDSAVLKYVSRGGLKMQAALDHLQFDVTGRVALDIGLSTGGFADCLLQRGASSVVGIDVGQNQVAEKLKSEPKLTWFEGLHVKDLGGHPEASKLVKGCDLCVIDVSFISLAQVLPFVGRAVKGGHRLLALVKPQFELSARHLNKRGVVKDEKVYEEVRTKIADLATECGYQVMDYFDCPIKGADGNQEFFLWAKQERWV